MKRKNYEKPTMDVVEVNHQQHLLTGSDSVSATMDGTWDEETIPEP
jgi:hypothetical protein